MTWREKSADRAAVHWESPSRAIKPRLTTRWEHKTSILGSIPHAVVPFLAGCAAVGSGYTLGILFLFFSHFFHAGHLFQDQDYPYLLYIYICFHEGVTPAGAGSRQCGEQPGKGFPRMGILPELIDGRERQRGAQTCRVMGGNRCFPRLQHLGTRRSTRDIPDRSGGLPTQKGRPWERAPNPIEG
jgi:hypothetical protein